MRSCLDEAMALDGAQAAALLDSERGHFLARRGHPLDDGLVHALTRLVHSEEVDDCVDDILVTRRPRLHLLQRTPRTGCYLFVELDRASSSMGLARSRLQLLARRLVPSAPTLASATIDGRESPQSPGATRRENSRDRLARNRPTGGVSGPPACAYNPRCASAVRSESSASPTSRSRC
ncbi:hypothetical protein OV079_53295 [Nannocystis pusilla]|uniref:Uncharacterized protein n=1 Tax=Nannocystis pusilla TaxID=889268 RepID=A0A9X3F155_9BACT|nr:hypothetical protein [Nannocystis pusilla]MCY1014152.1 hypothetical protein [Nannocystis pusilla]